MSKERIEEMAKDICCICHAYTNCVNTSPCTMAYIEAEELCKSKGYRKQSEEGSECPICHGTGRIGTTDWLTKNMTKKQLAEEKAKAIAEHEQHIKSEVAREIIGEILANHTPDIDGFFTMHESNLAELKKKYTGEQP